MILDDDELVRVRCGDGFVLASIEQANEVTEKELKNKRAEISGLLSEKAEIEAKMAVLKISLSAKFGDAIKLD